MPHIRHKYAFFICCFTCLILSGVGCAALINSDDSALLTPQATYTVINKWQEDSGKEIMLRGRQWTRSAAYHLTFATAPPQGSVIVLPTEHLGVTAFTGGKILYKAAPEIGQRFHLIPLDGVKENGTVYLHLTPQDRLTGSVTGTVKCTTPNDWLLSLLRENLGTPVCLAAIAALSLLLITLILRGKRYYRLLYLLCFLCLLGSWLAAGSALLQGIVGSAVMIHALRYTAYTLLTVPLLSLTAVCAKRPRRLLYALQSVIGCYALLRLILLSCCAVPLDRWLWMAHLLTGGGVLCMIPVCGDQIRNRKKG